MSPNVSQRMAEVRTQIMARTGSFHSEANPKTPVVALWRALQVPELSFVQIRAEYLYELVKLAPIEIPSLWTLAGEHLSEPYNILHGIYLDDKPQDRKETLQLFRKLGITEEKQADIIDKEVSQWWQNWRGEDSRYAFIGRRPEENRLGESHRGHSESMVYWAYGWIESHSIRDYPKVIRIGYDGLLKEIEAKIDALKISDPEYQENINFLFAGRRVCQAGILLGERYAALAEKQASQASGSDEKNRLLEMAETCRQVPKYGAQTFRQATQALWFAHILTCGEDGINANSIGRMDQFFWPYYKADIEAGILTSEQALELMQELACKLYLEYDVQAITLGGCDSQGLCAVNDLSYIILQATQDMEYVRDLSIRIDQDTPKKFVEKACELIVCGGGIPFIFNDKCFIKALTDRGIELKDARNYAPIGCVELTIPGKANPHAISGWFNTAKCLELAMYDGKCWQQDRQLGPKTGKLADFKTFEDFYQAYCRQVEFFAELMVSNINWRELAQREKGPLPCWSILTDDCIKKGRDITNGGAKYNYHSICLLGAPNTADSLWALKRFLFDDKSMTAEEIITALQADFEGYETLRNRMLNEADKYGNDSNGVDGLTARICDDFINLMDTMHSSLGGIFFVHLFSFLCNLHFGNVLGATPDGRHAGEPLAYSLSANQGRDCTGITAMLKSLSGMPHSKAAGGSAAIVEITPAIVEGPGGVRIMQNLIETAITIGVGQLQWNVVTAERLRQAQNNPEKYGNLAVRVAGFSQMFKLLDTPLQDHIIARTKHNR